MVKFRLQNVDIPQTTMEKIESLLYLVAEEFHINQSLTKVGYRSFLACTILFHVKMLETDKSNDYSDLELRLLLDTFEKFMRRDIHTRFVPLEIFSLTNVLLRVRDNIKRLRV